MEAAARLNNTQADVAIRAQGKLLITGFTEMQRRQQVHGDTLQQTIVAHMANSGAQLTALLAHLNTCGGETLLYPMAGSTEITGETTIPPAGHTEGNPR